MAYSYNFRTKDLISAGRSNVEALKSIRSWLEANSTTNDTDLLFVACQTVVPPSTKLPDELLVLFLISCNNSVANTKRTIEAYYRCKQNAPEIFADRNIDQNMELVQAMRTVCMASIPKRTANNDAIHFFKLQDTNYENFQMASQMKASYMLLDITQKSNPPEGLIVVIDCKGMNLMHLTRLRMDLLRKYFEFLQEGLPVKLRAIHIVNTVYFVHKLLNIAKVFMKSHLMEMLKLHPPNMTWDRLHEVVPRDCLPSDYGGTLPTIAELNEDTIEQFRLLADFFDAEEQLRNLDHNSIKVI